MQIKPGIFHDDQNDSEQSTSFGSVPIVLSLKERDFVTVLLSRTVGISRYLLVGTQIGLGAGQGS